jgi:hypothetical protein
VRRAAPRAVAVWLAGVLLLTACTTSSPDDDGTGGTDRAGEAACDDADPAVVTKVMDTANTDFQDGDSVVRSFELVDSATAPIPDDQQKFGAERLMVLLVSVTIDDDEVPDDLQGAQGPVYVVLDADGQPLGPLGTFSQPYFDLEPPADPGWTAWADGLDQTDVASDLFGCVNPA